MPPLGAPEKEEAPEGLPQPLAQQIDLIRTQLEPVPARPGSDLVRFVDAGLLNICELAEVGMELLNRVLAMRAAAERLSQAVDMSGSTLDPETDEAHARARAELAALEEVLAHARPSRATLAMGVRW